MPPRRNNAAPAEFNISHHIFGTVKNVLSNDVLAMRPREKRGSFAFRARVGDDFLQCQGNGFWPQLLHHGDLLGWSIDPDGFGRELKDQRITDGLPHRLDGWPIIFHCQTVAAVGTADMQVQHAGAGISASRGAVGEIRRRDRQRRMHSNLVFGRDSCCTWR